MPTPVRKRSSLAVGVEVGGGDAQAGLIELQAERRRGLQETAVPLVRQQGVAQAPWADDRRRQVDVELAVAVGVEGGDGRAEAGSNPADHGLVPLVVLGSGPAVAGGEFHVQRAGASGKNVGFHVEREPGR